MAYGLRLVGGTAIHTVLGLPQTVLRHAEQHSLWERRNVGITFIVAAGLVTAGWIWWTRRRLRRGVSLTHPRLLHTGVSVVAALTTLLGVAVLVNAYAGYAPSLSALSGQAPATSLPTAEGQVTSGGQTEEKSTIISMRIAAPEEDIGARTTYVYLPPGYFDRANLKRRYPVVYLLHGVPGYPSDWLMGGNLRATMDALIRGGQIEPMMVVMPQINSSFFDDSECLNIPGSEQDESYLTERVVRTVDSTFRTIPTRSARAIGGMSAGGFCALNLALRHVNEFSVILSSEPYYDPGSALVRRLHSWALWHANAPRDYLPTMPFSEQIAVFLDAGSQDQETLAVARWLATELVRRGQYVALRVAPHETHTWTTARLELPYSLVFANAHFHQDEGGSVAT